MMARPCSSPATAHGNLRAEHAPAMRHLFPSAEIAVIDNAGHWLHAERPAAFLAIVDAFLRQ